MPNERDFISSTPWAILPDRLHEMAAALPARLAALSMGEADLQERFEQAQMSRTKRQQEVAVLPLYGVIEQKPSLMGWLFGGTSTEMFAADLRAAVADPSVKSILIDVNSPGGSVYGVEELANELRAAKSKKTIEAIANSEAASAAYHIASQVPLAASPSAMVGSIGVVYVHQDWSQALEKMGVKTSVITSGKYKWEGSEYAPLTEEARAYLQKVADSYYGSFVANVAKGRGVSEATVRNGFGQGRMVLAREAKAAGMVDRVATFAQTYVRLGGQMASAPPPEDPAGLDLLNAEPLAEPTEAESTGGDNETRDPEVLLRLWEISRATAQKETSI